jgi:hypothetical protein
MPEQTFYFAGPLSNTGGGLRSVKLAPPFKIERWGYEKLASLVGDMQGASEWQPDHRVDELNCIPEFANTGHVVTACITLEHDESDTQSFLKLHHELESQDKRLDEQIRLLSLYFSAATTMPVRYWFSLADGRREMMSSSEGRAEKGERAAPTYQEALKVNAFLSKHSFEKRAEFIQIALDHWGHSHDTIPRHMQLLSLVTALEVLLNPAQTELKHRVTRAAAVLIGTTKEDSRDIYSGLSKIYDVRSQIVHTGQLKSLQKVHFWQLRWWLSRAILAVMDLGLPKDQMCAALVELGFGQGSNLKQLGSSRDGR